jgi:hypothetical protein
VNLLFNNRSRSFSWYIYHCKYLVLSLESLRKSEPQTKRNLILVKVILSFCYFSTILKYSNCLLLNRTTLVHNFVLIYLLLFSTCFRRLCAHHQEKIPYLCDTWYLSLYINACLVRRALHTRQSSIKSDKYQVSHR